MAAMLVTRDRSTVAPSRADAGNVGSLGRQPVENGDFPEYKRTATPRILSAADPSLAEDIGAYEFEGTNEER